MTCTPETIFVTADSPMCKHISVNVCFMWLTANIFTFKAEKVHSFNLKKAQVNTWYPVGVPVSPKAGGLPSQRSDELQRLFTRGTTRISSPSRIL